MFALLAAGLARATPLAPSDTALAARDALGDRKNGTSAALGNATVGKPYDHNATVTALNKLAALAASKQMDDGHLMQAMEVIRDKGPFGLLC